MLSFEGKYKTKRKEKSYAKTITSSDVIFASRELRKERQHQRREEESCLLIQRVYRGYRCRIRVIAAARLEFESVLNQTSTDLSHLINLFLFISRHGQIQDASTLKFVRILLDSSPIVDNEKNISLISVLAKYLGNLPAKAESKSFSLVFQLIVIRMQEINSQNNAFSRLFNRNIFENICSFIRNQNHLDSIKENNQNMNKYSLERLMSAIRPIDILLDHVKLAPVKEASQILLAYLNSITMNEYKNCNVNYFLICRIIEHFHSSETLRTALLCEEIKVKPNLVYAWLIKASMETIDFINITERLVRQLIHLQNIRVDFAKGFCVHLGAGHLIPFCKLESNSLRPGNHHIDNNENSFLREEYSEANDLLGYSFNWKTIFGLLRERLKAYVQLQGNNLTVANIKSICCVYYLLTYVYRSLTFDQVLNLNACLSSSLEIILKFYECLQTLTVTVTDSLPMKFVTVIKENGFPHGTKASEIDDFFAVCTTFCATLRHYLLRMSDEEIDTRFQSHNLLTMNNFLLDIILGLINLSHPLKSVENDNLNRLTIPKENLYSYRGIYLDRIFEMVNLDSFNVSCISGDQNLNGIMLSHNQRLDDSIFKRIMQKIDETHSSENQADFMDVDDDHEEGEKSPDGRDQISHHLYTLHRYRECFLTMQKVINQIYLWHQRKEQLLTRKVTKADDKTKDSLWTRDNIVDLIVAQPDLIISWISAKASDTDYTLESSPLALLAKSPFGYFSAYNTVDGVINQGLSLEMIRLIRQIIVLLQLPFIVKFSVRNQILRALVLNKADSRISFDPFSVVVNDHLSIRIRRTHIYEDAFESLSKLNAPSLRPQFKVTFINEHRVEEIGYDGGGLSREFLTDLISTAFDPIRGLFLLTDSKDFPALYPNPAVSEIIPNYKEHYFFLGRILGKALSMGMLLEIRFAVFFLAKIVSKSSRSIIDFAYLKTLDQDLYKNLKFLKNYEGNVVDLGLDFTLNENMFSVKTIDLVPNGSSIRVTNENRLEYIIKVTNYKLNLMIKEQTDEFIKGLADVLCIDWLRIYDCFELQTLISGSQSSIDINDLKKHTEYYQRALAESETVLHFWELIESFTQDELRSLLRFVTGCSSPPMFGFENLHPPFTIHIVPELDRLPTASTCVNMLKIPDYKDYNTLRDKLKYALNSKAGFDYS